MAAPTIIDGVIRIIGFGFLIVGLWGLFRVGRCYWNAISTLRADPEFAGKPFRTLIEMPDELEPLSGSDTRALSVFRWQVIRGILFTAIGLSLFAMVR